jgi:hypothetical protein
MRGVRALAVVGVAIMVGAVAVRVTHRGARAATTLPNDVNVTTTRVVRTDLVATEQIDGALEYAPAAPVVDELPGTYTAMPAEGDVVPPGGTLFSVDDQPVVLLRGNVPAWRDFTPGMTDGVDVAELQYDLVASGRAPHLAVDGRYRWPTIVAVRAWRSAHGLPVGDALPLGQVVFAPGSVRVGKHQSDVGDRAQPGSAPYDTTATTRVVAIELDVARRGDVRAGEAVTIELPSGATVAGHVTSVGRVAHAPTGSAAGGSGSDNQPVVSVVVTPERGATIDDLDQTPVAVDVVTDRRDGVLAVPITALLARPGGGDAVEVVGAHGEHRLVAVTAGLFSDTLVEIRGAGIDAATTVVTAR